MASGWETDDYRGLFLDPTPMLDLRSPAEFARGAFPAAASLPLMSDEERAQVGICYKERGQRAAVELGHRLVSGDTRAARLADWVTFARDHPGGCLYCWRGGLRSELVQQWLAAEGIDYPRVRGGYKALRRFLLEELEHSVAAGAFILVSGRTGTGKTRVIERLARAVDLEGLAVHRGSTFGRLPAPQPSQIDFENALSIELMRLFARGSGAVFIEDEGRLIGRLYLPGNLQEAMKQAPLAVIEENLERRVDVVLEDYIVDLGRRYLLLHGEEGFDLHRDKMQGDLARIAKRLGGERLKQVSAMMDAAFATQWRSGDTAAHRDWIAYLLEGYYDPMYDYQLAQRRGRVLFCGAREAVVAWARERAQHAATA